MVVVGDRKGKKMERKVKIQIYNRGSQSRPPWYSRRNAVKMLYSILKTC